MPKRKPVCLVALLLLSSPCALSAAAQTRTRPRRTATPPPAAASPAPEQVPARREEPARDIAAEEADVAITANVTAQSLRFDAVPNANVEFTGHPWRETVWDAERTNLPRPVQPGVTYRDIGIRLKIVSVFADIDRIVAEALGEVPPEGEAPPPPPPDAGPSPEIQPGAATPHQSVAAGRPRAGGPRAVRRGARAGGKGGAR